MQENVRLTSTFASLEPPHFSKMWLLFFSCNNHLSINTISFCWLAETFQNNGCVHTWRGLGSTLIISWWTWWAYNGEYHIWCGFLSYQSLQVTCYLPPVASEVAFLRGQIQVNTTILQFKESSVNLSVVFTSNTRTLDNEQFGSRSDN